MGVHTCSHEFACCHLCIHRKWRLRIPTLIYMHIHLPECLYSCIHVHVLRPPQSCLVPLEQGLSGCRNPWAAAGNAQGPRAWGNGFFPPNKSTPHPGSWKPGPGASMCSQPGGQGSASPHVGSLSSHLLSCFQIRSLLPGKLQPGFTGSDCSQPREALAPLSQRGFVGWGFFIPLRL